MSQKRTSVIRYIWDFVPDAIKSTYTPKQIILIEKYSVLLSVIHSDSRECYLLKIEQHKFRYKKYTCSIQSQDSLQPSIFSQSSKHRQKKNQLFHSLRSTPAIPYILLSISAFLLLFSFYHYLTSQPKHDITPDFVCSFSPAVATDIPATTSPPAMQTHTSSPPTPTPCHILDISQTSHQTDASLSKHLSTVPSYDKVTTIFAASCKLTSLAPFAPFSNLRELYLSDNPLTFGQIPSSLSKLNILVLSDCHLKDVQPISVRKSLTVLDLSHNLHLKHIRSLSSLKHLQYLILTDTNASQKDIAFLKAKLPQCNIIY